MNREAETMVLNDLIECADGATSLADFACRTIEKAQVRLAENHLEAATLLANYTRDTMEGRSLVDRIQADLAAPRSYGSNRVGFGNL